MASVIAFTHDQEVDQRPQNFGDFAAIVASHQRMVFSIALHMLGRTPEAEELAQEVFLQLYRHLSEIESESHLLNWLRRVTTNRCIDHARRNRVIPISFERIAEPSSAERSPDPLLSRTLRTLLASLPASQRAVVTLRYQEDLEPREIAAVLGVPVSTVKSHLHRALVSLRRKVNLSPRRVV